MKRKMIGAMLMLLMTSGAANATCLETWPPDMKARPDFTCVPFTDQLLVSLEGATKAQVIKAMKANGRWLDHDTMLHFVSIADDNQGGDVNFAFKNDKVVRIVGSMDGEHMIEFIWNPAFHGSLPSACSDLPGSHYARCNNK
jgi:hypothetical protein